MAECPGRIDLHMHTTVSDGTDTPEEILKKVKDAGIDLFSVTDHDSVNAAGIITGIRSQDDPRFISGVEFSCRDGEGKYHVLGYGFDPEHPAILGLVSAAHRSRRDKVRARLEFLKNEFGFTFPDYEIERLFAQENPGKPHIGNLMVKYGYAKSKESAINDYINRARVKNNHVEPGEAIEGILASGGIPVLAHPYYGSGDELILGDDMDRRLRRLVGSGLRGVEAFYSGFSEKMCSDMVELADRYGLYVTAGSDYHGKNKMVILGDTGLGGVSEYPAALIRFLKEFTP